MKLLISYLKNYKLLIFFSLCLAAINQVFSLLDPYIFGKIIDKFANHPKDFTQNEFLMGMGFLLLLSIGSAMISRIAKAFQDYTVSLVTQKMGAQLYTDGLMHSLKLPFQQFEDQRSGETLNILQKVRSDSEKFISNFINVLFAAFVGIIFVMIYAIQLDTILVFVYLFAAFLMAFVTNILSKKIKIVQKEIMKETNVLAGATTESLRNIELIKSLGLTNQEINRLNLTTLKILKLELKKVRNIRSISFMQGTFVNLLRQSILFFILFLIFKEKLSIGQLMTLQFYSFFIFNPLQEMGNIIMSYREAESSLQNFQKIINTPLEKVAHNAKTIEIINNLSFSNVSFKHKTAKSNALDQISFEVKKGESIAFVGPSGSGKTTMVKLLASLYLPLEGEIKVNGVEFNSINIEDIRDKIGLVTQDTQLFSGTIKDNLLFVKPNSTDEEIIEAMRKAACNNLLSRTDKGIYSVIGEGGMKLSGGEKQRLSIARAILRDSQLIIFDEATSALDSITEAEITNTIKEVTIQKDRITVMIAHRLSTIMHADRIYVLEKGQIIETGTHQNLVAEKGLYYAMWRQQIGEKKE